MIHDFLIASLGVNKIVDQGAHIKRLQSANRTLVNDYNSLLEKYNVRGKEVDHFRSELNKVAERARDDSAYSDHTLTTVMKQKGEAQKQVEYYKGQIENLDHKVYRLEKEIEEVKKKKAISDQEIEDVKKEKAICDDMDLAVQMIFARLTDLIPEDILLAAAAETFANHPPQALQDEFEIKASGFEEAFMRNFVGAKELGTEYCEIEKSPNNVE